MKIACDTVTGQGLAAAFTAAAKRAITYGRLPAEILAADPDLRHMAASLENGPLSDQVDLMRTINPELTSFRSWLAGAGHAAFDWSFRAGTGQCGDAG